MKKNIGVIGSGMVGKALASGFVKYGYNVVIASNDAAKRKDLSETLQGITTGSFEDTAKFGETIVLAVKGSAAEEVVKQLGKNYFKGKIILDTTNPIAEVPPVKGVLQYFTPMNESLMERLQKLAPEAKFVKAFSCVGAAFMVDPDFGGVKPTMFVCGNDAGAKHETSGILEQFGWDTEDMGDAESARAIEPLAMLWCIPGIRENRWTHAFKLLKL